MNQEIRQANLKQTPRPLSWQVATIKQGSVLQFSSDMQEDRPAGVGPLSSQIKCLWAAKWALWRRQKRAMARSPLAKAAAIKKHHPRVIWDLTCGIGYDSLWFLCWGQKVIAFERHPAMVALVQANLAAPDLNPWPWEALGGSFSLYEGDFQKKVQTEAESLALLPHPDVLYLDPMFGDEGNKRRSLPQKNLQLLPQLVGLDEDAPQLLAVALAWAKEHQVGRVILKRPIRAPLLLNPDWQIKAQQVRFDGWTTGKKLD